MSRNIDPIPPDIARDLQRKLADFTEAELQDFQRRLRAFFEQQLALPPAQGWQPIETAKKDGSELLLTNGYRVESSRWAPHPMEPMTHGTWLNFHHGLQPTHWMPLPAPPVAAKETP